MTKDHAKLSMIQDQVFEDPRFKAQIDPVTKAMTTFCNLSCHAIARAYGCMALLNLQTNQPYTADEIYAVLQASKDFTRKDIGECQDLVNQGSLIFAIKTSQQLGQSHGHIVTLTPGNKEWSNHWTMYVPSCMSIGSPEATFRNKGINFAFPVDKGIPDFYVWNQSL